jgi:Phytanoyl-CoA dioxygenase (PhyH)
MSITSTSSTDVGDSDTELYLRRTTLQSNGAYPTLRQHHREWHNDAMLRETIENDGFAIVPAVLERQEILSVIEKLSNAPLRHARAGARHLMANQLVAALANDPRLLGIARGILGAFAFPFRATLFDKSPRGSWLVVWHQDTALPLRERQDVPGWGPWSVKEGINYAHAPTHALNQVLALRIHLDDSTEHNGPLRVLPGTHKLGVLTDDEVSQLAAERSPVDCVVPQGGVLAMRPLIIHSSSKSQAEIPRRVLHIEYASSLMVGDRLELAVA